MITLDYNDFNDFYININKSLLNKEINTIYNKGLSYYLPHTIVNVKSNKFDYNLKNGFYTTNKIKTLYNDYINKDKLKLFGDNINQNHNSITFYFNETKGKRGNINNLPCILNLVFTKENSNKFNRLMINYRTCELSKRLLADLILINEILDWLKEFIDLKLITFNFNTCFINIAYLTLTLKNFNLDYDKLDLNNNLQKEIYLFYNNLKEKQGSKRKTYNRMFNMLRKRNLI